MGASKERPSDGPLSSTIDFALPHTLSDTVRESEAVCTGPETYYLWWTVSDTGRGIKTEEKTKLFSRFQQASPRTYSKYGGSYQNHYESKASQETYHKIRLRVGSLYKQRARRAPGRRDW